MSRSCVHVSQCPGPLFLSLGAHKVRVAAKVLSGRNDALSDAAVTAQEIALELKRLHHKEKSANGGEVAIALNFPKSANVKKRNGPMNYADKHSHEAIDDSDTGFGERDQAGRAVVTTYYIEAG